MELIKVRRIRQPWWHRLRHGKTNVYETPVCIECADWADVVVEGSDGWRLCRECLKEALAFYDAHYDDEEIAEITRRKTCGRGEAKA